MTIAATGATQKVITPHDYCDRCVAKAYFMVSLNTGDLYFCAHHFSKYESIFLDMDLDVYDNSGSLFKRPVI